MIYSLDEVTVNSIDFAEGLGESSSLLDSNEILLIRYLGNTLTLFHSGVADATAESIQILEHPPQAACFRYTALLSVRYNLTVNSDTSVTSAVSLLS
jgi:hypothetical protein